MTRSHTQYVLHACLLALFGLGMAGSAQAGPVVAELFTSNSCSSCPPAYVTLEHLVKQHQNSDSPIIRLDEHVDYWNQLNWVDRYSKAQFSNRQRHYANAVFHDGRVYTPELVVNGRRGMVGSNDRRAAATINNFATSTQPLDVTLDKTGSAITAHVNVPADLASLPIWFAITQDDVVSHVGTGENAGRTLTENGVVRWLEPGGTADGGDRVSRRLPLPKNVDAAHLNVVAFVQDTNKRIVAAGTVAVDKR